MARVMAKKRSSGAYTDKGQTDISYRSRIVDKLLDKALSTFGAVQIVGPKWCGKTTTAEQASQSAIYFQDPDERANNIRIASEKPSLLLNGEKPVLLDEWQDAPKIWDAVRFAVDKSKGIPGQYILTGSSVIDDKDREIMHSGVGRFSRVMMRPMSLYESGESCGSISLSDILAQSDVYGKADADIGDIASAIARGGWPASIVRNDMYAAHMAQDYVESIIESDISRVDRVEKNPRRVRMLMRSLARNESTEAKMTTLQADISADEGGLSTNTIAVYLNALRRLYVLEEQDSWTPAVRARTAIRTSPVRRYCDPSIAAALLRMTPEKLLVDYNTFGLLFESLCVRDLRIYAEAIDGAVYHYRDARGLECDAIIEFGDGRWGAVEMKLGSSNEDAAARNLLKIRDSVKSQHGGEASFLMVVTADGIGYRRDDGVYSIPISCLKP
jgi:predicted AAA+ superfamily ATPase